MNFEQALKHIQEGWAVHTYDWDDWDVKSVELREGKLVITYEGNKEAVPYKFTGRDKESTLWGLVAITDKYRPDCLVCDDTAQKPKLTNLL